VEDQARSGRRLRITVAETQLRELKELPGARELFEIFFSESREMIDSLAILPHFSLSQKMEAIGQMMLHSLEIMDELRDASRLEPLVNREDTSDGMTQLRAPGT